MIPLLLDHIVLAAPVLADAVAEFAERTGVTPTPGGSHPGWGTANCLVGLGGDAYLEIIGPDPLQAGPMHGVPDRRRPFGVDELDVSRVVTWAVHPSDPGATIAAARQRGYDPGDAASMSRRTAGGDRLDWQLTPYEFERSDGLVPFLIDWGSTPHPTTRMEPQVRLVSMTATHPRPDDVHRMLAALGVELTVTRADLPTLTVVIDTPRGRVTL